MEASGVGDMPATRPGKGRKQADVAEGHGGDGDRRYTQLTWRTQGEA